MWEDLAEIRTIAVGEAHQGRGAGHEIVRALLATARQLGVRRVFVLTFAVPFFQRHGFEVIKGDAATPEVYAELLRSYDEGVAEFLDLDRVKPNTLGNTRMLLRLPPPEARRGLPRGHSSRSWRSARRGRGGTAPASSPGRRRAGTATARPAPLPPARSGAAA